MTDDTADTAIARLYLVTPADFDPDRQARAAAALIGTGLVECLRLDLGSNDDEGAWQRAANTLLPLCHHADVALVIADHHRLVGPLGLDGVHLARSRTPIREVRKALGKEAIIGAWGGAERHRAMTLAEAGADYVAIGPVANAGGLGDGAAAEDDLFAWWSEMIEVPVVAEGGVSRPDAARLARTTDFVVPDPVAVWSDPDPARALEDFARAMREGVG